MNETIQYIHPSQGAPMETTGDPNHHYWPPTSNMNQPLTPKQPFQPQQSQHNTITNISTLKKNHESFLRLENF